MRDLLLNGGKVGGALKQSDFGADFAKPTRLLTNVPGVASHLYEGAPSFDDNEMYVGPLPQGPRQAVQLIGRAGRGFKTSAAAAWPDDLCKTIARAILDHRGTYVQGDGKALTEGMGRPGTRIATTRVSTRSTSSTTCTWTPSTTG